jgi:pimeloyl-ACP methyl ester carboxylesterase
MTTTVRALTLPLGRGDLGLTLTVDGGDEGHPFLLLHGGAGPMTVASFAGLLTEQRPARVFTPVHPGFDGTVRPDWLTDVPTLAHAYLRLLDELGLSGVTVVGNSIGGWIAAEMALLGGDRIGGVVLVDAVGIHVPGHPVADPSSLTPAELARLAYHDPEKFGVDPARMSEEQRAVMLGNRAAVATYAGRHGMTDPTLRERLAKVSLPTRVVWGESDRVVDLDYGRAFAEAIPGAEFVLLHETGHLPQIESPRQLLATVQDFADAHTTSRPGR